MKKNSLLELQYSLSMSGPNRYAIAQIKKKKKKEPEEEPGEEITEEELDEMVIAILYFFFDEQLQPAQLNDSLRNLAGKVLHEAQKASDAMDWVPRPSGSKPNFSWVLKQAAKAIKRQIDRGASNNFGKITRDNLDNARIYQTVRVTVGATYRTEYTLAKMGEGFSLAQGAFFPVNRRVVPGYLRAQSGPPEPERIPIIPREPTRQEDEFIAEVLHYFYGMGTISSLVTDRHRDLAAKLIWAAASTSMNKNTVPAPTNNAPTQQWLLNVEVITAAMDAIQQDKYMDVKFQVAEDFRKEYERIQQPTPDLLPNNGRDAQPMAQSIYGYQHDTPRGIFDSSAVTRMKTWLVDNASQDDPCNCIDTVNTAVKKLLNKNDLSLGTSVQSTMGALNRAGYASDPVITEHLDAGGSVTKGIKRPEKLQKSLHAVMKEMGGSEKGWSVFGLSIMDGYHSVLISLDNSDTANPKLYWSDQWTSKGGWKEYSITGLDDEVTRLTKAWWDKKPQDKKPKTRATLWRLYRHPQA